ncbi:tetratricopeptide repeat protein [Cylindrospermum sp. NIES-4074]|nr:tetratricopeptide repeat protein [Cylindrospermum sp. NIES-4074]
MNFKIAVIFSLVLLPFSAFALENRPYSLSQATVKSDNCKIEGDNGDGGEYSQTKLQTLANQITVRVIGDSNGGSGTILAKKGNTYLVATNSHVILGVKNVRVKTFDGNIYTAQIIPNTNFEKLDLALLEFQSNQNYCLPKEIADFTPTTDKPVLAVGYSSAKGEIVFRTGKVQQISEQSLKEGYQIGYTSDIEQGMSGGAIINIKGTLIGINGKSAYPILNSGYVYADGKRPTDAEIQEMRKLSWGIPVTTLLEQVKPEIITAYSLPLPKSPQQIPTLQLTGWLGELEEKAKQITVRIDSSHGGNGSGVIIAKQGDIYTVLTVAHAVCGKEEATQVCGKSNYQILAYDGKEYAVEPSSIKVEEGVDLAVVKFRSQENYQVATLASYSPRDDEYIFTAGYPELGNNSPWRFTTGKIFSKEQGLLTTSQSDFQSNISGSLQSAISLTGGYELVYKSITFGGMSGGPVLDSQGRVIGIHGRAEGEAAIGEDKVQIGNSLGIPISTFVGIATRLGTQKPNIENTPAPQLNKQNIESIKKAILSADVSKSNATASQWLERGNQLWRLNRYEEAVQAFDTAIKLKPSFIYLAYYGKGLALSGQKKYQDSVAAFEQAVKYKPDFVAAWLQKSLIYRKLKQLDQALVAINKAIQLQPKNPNLYNAKLVVLNKLKKYAEAETAINEAIKLSPRASFYNNRANLYKYMKKWDLAVADYIKAIEINPEYALAYTNRGNLYQKQKKWDLALADYIKAIEIDPEDARAYDSRGNFYQKQKKWDLALADYNKAIEINPQYAKAYVGRGSLYLLQEKWDLALADSSKAIEIDPEDATAYNIRGNFYQKQKKWDLALADYNKAIEIDPEDATAYNFRGNFYQKQKKWDLALADYTKAIEINPEDATAYNFRGNFYQKQKKWDLALADYNKAIEIDPEDATAYIGRGWFYYIRGDKQKAIQNLQQAAQLFLAQGDTANYELISNLLKNISK